MQMNDHEKEEIGKVAGMGLGMAGGAQVGSMVIPIPLVGAFTGAVLGGALGSVVGRRAGKAVIDGALAFVDALRGTETAPATVNARVIEIQKGRGGYA